jgi:hypothetical protein
VVSIHDARHIAQGVLDRGYWVVNQTLAQCHQKQGLAVRRTFAVGVMHVVDKVLYFFAAVVPIANFAVVHEGPVLPNKRMAIASVDRSACGGSDMRKK